MINKYHYVLYYVLGTTYLGSPYTKKKHKKVKYFTFCPKTRLIPPLWDTLGHKKKVKYFVSGGKNENIPPKHFIFFWNFTSRLLDFVLTSRQIRLRSFQITHNLKMDAAMGVADSPAGVESGSDFFTTDLSPIRSFPTDSEVDALLNATSAFPPGWPRLRPRVLA